MSALRDSSAMPRLEVTNEVATILESFCQLTADDREACGLLIGTHSLAGERIRIEHATIPSKEDIRSRFSFKLRDISHQQHLDRLFLSSGREKVLLGTWHSHPEPRPRPSEVDRRDWLKQFRLNETLLGRMVFSIVGTAMTRFWLVERRVKNRIDIVEVFNDDQK